MIFNKNFNKLVLVFFVIMLFVGGSIFTGCGKHADDHDHAHEAGEADHDHAQEAGEADHDHEGEGETDTAAHRHLHVAPELIKKWNIQYTEPKIRDYVETISLTGVVKANRETTYIINALVSGIVTQLKKDIGQPVKKGDVLCILNSPELLELKTRYIKAFQEYRLTKENYQRTRKLFDINAIEKKELISRDSAYKTAMAEYFSLEAELGTVGFDEKSLETVKNALTNDRDQQVKEFLSPYYRILSPGPGKVVMRDLHLGERVENNKAIYEISDTGKLWVIMDAMEKDLQYIARGQSLTVESDVYPGREFNGKILALMEKIDPELRTVKVRAEVDNPESRLKPEMYVRGKLETAVEKQYPCIPTSALVKIGGADGVFVIDTDGFAFKPVRVVDTDSKGFAFVEGIHKDDLVINRGAFYLKAEMEIQTGSADPHAGHNH